MFTQTSVKRSLAFSTIAQMGFMMLQCGLGSFSAALLHIVAHSLYKAHAFLSSGSILTLAARMPPSQSRSFSWKASLGMSFLSTILAVAILSASLFLFGLRLDEKPGGWVLGLVLAMALSRLMSTAMETGYLRLSILGIGAAAGVAVLYLSLFEVMDTLLKETVSHQPVADSPFDITVSAVAMASFFLMFILTHFTQGFSHFWWMHRFYVHANNGFYLDIPLRRITARIYGQRAAVS
jgi:NAD(P)H-quinone oxidoreductase subunit 5